jgi:hypothetical protein
MRTSKPVISFYTRISLESEELRRKLEARLGLTASGLLERALQALAKELETTAEPAE